MIVNIEIRWFPLIKRLYGEIKKNISDITLIKKQNEIFSWYLNQWEENTIYGYKISKKSIVSEKKNKRVLYIANFQLEANDIDLSLFVNPPTDVNTNPLIIKHIGVTYIAGSEIENVYIKKI